MSFEENIRSWVHLDNEILILNEKLTNLKNKKKLLNNDIIVFLNEKNINNPTIKINDGKLKIIDNQFHQALTYKHLNLCLLQFFRNDNDYVNKLINFIKSKRTIKTTQEIKRFSDLNQN